MVNRTRVEGGGYSKHDIVTSVVSITCGATHAGRILFDTKPLRENSRVAFRDQGDAVVRQIASMNDSYGYTIVNYVWPHYSSVTQLAGVFGNKLTADAG